MNLTTFAEDFDNSTSAEIELANFLNRILPIDMFKTVKTKVKSCDVYSLIEVKLQEDSARYGTFFIELTDEGKPSGLNSTKANLWAIIDKEYYYLIPTTLLKEFAKESKEIKSEYAGTSGFKLDIKMLREHPGVRIIRRQLCPNEI